VINHVSSISVHLSSTESSVGVANRIHRPRQPAPQKAYDADASRRIAAGLSEVHVLREYANKTLVALMFKVSDLGRNVRDFATALEAYSIDAADRKASSLTDLGVLQLRDDPNNILIVWAVGDVARATAFFDSPALAAHMATKAGVVGPPERHFWKD
jgi:hypothetical protein